MFFKFYQFFVSLIPVKLKQKLKNNWLSNAWLEPAFKHGAEFVRNNLKKFEKKPRPSIVISQQLWSGPLVSVIVTCYNYGSFLDSVLGCLAVQTFSNFEIILIDDGSTDSETVARIEELKKLQRSNFTVIQQPNQGVIAARNNAIVKAQGKYIFPLDADDTIEPTFLEKSLLFLENSPNYFFAYTWTHSTGDKDYVWKTRDCELKKILGENRMGNALFRKTAFMQVGGYNPIMADGYEDWEFYVNLVAHGFIGRVIKEPLYNYYVKPGSRNYHATKKHSALKAIISDLHLATLKANKRHLLKLAQQPYLVQNPLVNFSTREKEMGGEEFFLIDLYNSDIDVRTILPGFLKWFESTSATVLMTLKTPWVDLFSGSCLENLFVYYPEHYHPDGYVKPFYDYLELRYQPQRKSLIDLC